MNQCIKMFLNKSFIKKNLNFVVSKKELTILILPYLSKVSFDLKTWLRRTIERDLPYYLICQYTYFFILMPCTCQFCVLRFLIIIDKFFSNNTFPFVVHNNIKNGMIPLTLNKTCYTHTSPWRKLLGLIYTNLKNMSF